MHPESDLPPSLPTGVYALCDDTFRPELPLQTQAAQLLEGGARTLQVRIKRTGVREALAALREIVRACDARGALCIVNDRVDWALLTGAHGVHLGEEDLPVPEARRLLGGARLIGATVRSGEGARRAEAEGASYVGVGPIFATSTKQVRAPVMGLEALQRVVRESPLPVVAIGGLSLDTIEAVARCGVAAAAVVSAALGADDIPARVRALNAAFARGGLQRTVPPL